MHAKPAIAAVVTRPKIAAYPSCRFLGIDPSQGLKPQFVTSDEAKAKALAYLEAKATTETDPPLREG
jgi:hypothetical protein